MKCISTIAASLLLATFAHAATPAEMTADQSIDQLNASPLIYLGAFADGTPNMPQACKDANFTADQQNNMKNEIYQSQRKMVTLKGNLQLAMMDYGQVLKNTTSAITDAQTSAAGITAAISALAANKIDTLNTLLYNVLTPDQRDNALKCFKAVEKLMIDKKLEKICAMIPKQP